MDNTKELVLEQERYGVPLIVELLKHVSLVENDWIEISLGLGIDTCSIRYRTGKRDSIYSEELTKRLKDLLYFYDSEYIHVKYIHGFVRIDTDKDDKVFDAFLLGKYCIKEQDMSKEVQSAVELFDEVDFKRLKLYMACYVPRGRTELDYHLRDTISYQDNLYKFLCEVLAVYHRCCSIDVLYKDKEDVSIYRDATEDERMVFGCSAGACVIETGHIDIQKFKDFTLEKSPFDFRGTYEV